MPIPKRLTKQRELNFDRMFDTRSEAWERVGLAMQTSQRAIRRARREAAVVTPLLIAVLVFYFNRRNFLGAHVATRWQTPLEAVTLVLLLILGWTFARAVGQATAPIFFRRMDPATAGTVGFVIRLVALTVVLLIALAVALPNGGTFVAGSAVTAVVLGLAAQQTLNNLFAGLVLLSARPFRVGERVRLQAGAVAGTIEGVVSSLGLLYTTLARGEDRVMIPNNVVLNAAVVPLREPAAVDVRVRLTQGVRPTHVQALLDDRISTPTRSPAKVLLEEVDGEDVIVRVQATPERADDGAHLADQIIDTLASVTGPHSIARD